MKAAGSVQVKLGFVSPPKTQILLEFDEIFSELIRRSRPSLVSAPPVSLGSLPKYVLHLYNFVDGRCWHCALSRRSG